MNKKGKKLLALVLALAMSLQWLPVLADEPTVTVDKATATVTVDAGDQTGVEVSIKEYVMPKNGDIKIENGVVFVWSGESCDWVLLTDENGNPVNPEDYNASEIGNVQDVKVILSDNPVTLVDSETGEQKPDHAESIIVNTGDVTKNGE